MRYLILQNIFKKYMDIIKIELILYPNIILNKKNKQKEFIKLTKNTDKK